MFCFETELIQLQNSTSKNEQIRKWLTHQKPKNCSKGKEEQRNATSRRKSGVTWKCARIETMQVFYMNNFLAWGSNST